MTKKEIIWHWASNALGISAPLVLIPYLISSFGFEQFGQIALVQIASQATVPVVDFGLSGSGPKWISQMAFEGNFKAGVMAVLGAHFIAWIAASLAGYLYISNIDAGLRETFFLSQLVVLLTTIPPVYILAQAGLHKPYGQFGFFSKIIFIVFVLAFVGKNSQINIYFFLQILVAIPSFLFLTYLLFERKLPSLKSGIEMSFILSALRLLKYSSPQVLQRTASIPIPLIVSSALRVSYGSSAVAVYSMIDKIRTVTWQAINPIISAFVARYFNRWANLNTMGDMLEIKTIKILTTIGFVLILGGWGLSEKIFFLLRIPISNSAINAWHLGLLGIIPSVAFAFLGAKLAPELRKSRSFTFGMWCLTALIIFFIKIYFKYITLFIAVSAIILWESVASVVIFFCIVAHE